MSEGQFRALEQKVEWLYRAVMDWILPQLRGAQQGIRGTYQQPTSSSTTAGADVYVACPAGSISPASGCPGAGAPGLGTADVYVISGGAYVLQTPGATIYNAMPDATTGGWLLILGLNPDGTYTAISQACRHF
jgi:hypothetical protein